ncbi:TRAP-type C4-dicarboxylate transport system permease small subunit [Paenochrobactrum gallinarii]|uniref:TRAP transporter small permease protein n=1 Tax=Paenochrobactrum gallinarii TaxID=643673 RepID=A0A841M493_9HYPH|nr:TRAP transporter small permease subunit [Paenochrobactrum gallinarii]MBB6262579.1 TRAP-type C4-dicarboxylate transport system permease small subunit [Paenochrobactrum gallinarii]
MLKILNRLNQVFALVGSVGYMFAIVFTLIDVVGRMIGMTFVYGTIDIVLISMVLAGSFAVPMAEWDGVHVKVDPLSAWMPTKLRLSADRFWRSLSGILLAVISWCALSEAMDAHAYGDVMSSIRISVAVLGILIFAGFGLGAITALLSVTLPGWHSKDQ